MEIPDKNIEFMKEVCKLAIKYDIKFCSIETINDPEDTWTGKMNGIYTRQESVPIEHQGIRIHAEHDVFTHLKD